MKAMSRHTPTGLIHGITHDGECKVIGARQKA